MSLQEQTPRSIGVTNGELEDDERWVIESIINATPPLSLAARIHKVPGMVKEKEDYEKYYVPKVVSIGPHHFGKQKLKLVEKLKPVFAMKLLSNNKETLTSLYKTLGEPKMVQELRNFYEENSTTEYCDKEFTKMMLLDGCFILYYIQFIFGGQPEICPELKSHQIVFVHQDFFLLENQIPFKVLREVMKLLNTQYCLSTIIAFINGNILASGRRKRTWFKSILGARNDQICRNETRRVMDTDPDHILHLLHRSLTRKFQVPRNDSSLNTYYRSTFPNVNELVDVGIHFKPSDTKSLAHIDISKGRWWFSLNVKLPPIRVDDSTKQMLLNLIAYEMTSHDAHDAVVTSYICLLDSLIDHPDDVKALRKAGVLEKSPGSDKKVVKLFNEIGTGLVPNSLAYLEANSMIQRHYKSRRKTLISQLISQLKHEYISSPWAFFAVVGALTALFLTGVQAYFTVWSPKGECDDLCMFLKKNHHL